MDDAVSRLLPDFGGNPVAVAWQIGLPLIVAVPGVRWRLRRRRGLFRLRWALLQVAALVGGLYAYKTARLLTEADHEPAVANARAIIRAEERLGLYFEPAFQEFVMRSDVATRAFNANYAYGFIPLVVAALTWLALVDERNYRLLRNGLGLSAVMAVCTIALFPVAPPRLVPEADLVDTLAEAGKAISFTNQYAAVPSLHVGWLVLVGLALSRSTSSWRRWLAFAPAVVMTLTVMATGNHYWFDALVGAVMAVGAVAALDLGAAGWERARASSRRWSKRRPSARGAGVRGSRKRGHIR